MAQRNQYCGLWEKLDAVGTGRGPNPAGGRAVKEGFLEEVASKLM